MPEVITQNAGSLGFRGTGTSGAAGVDFQAARSRSRRINRVRGKALAAAGAIVQLAGRPGENEANWRQAGVKSFIFMGCDVLSTLQAAHDILAVK